MVPATVLAILHTVASPAVKGFSVVLEPQWEKLGSPYPPKAGVSQANTVDKAVSGLYPLPPDWYTMVIHLHIAVR